MGFNSGFKGLKNGHVNICLMLLALWAWFWLQGSCFRSEIRLFELGACETVRPHGVELRLHVLQQLLINQSSALCHSASITAPALFESHSHNIIGRTILIAKINLHYSLFHNKCWLFMYHYLATEYTVIYLALYLL